METPSVLVVVIGVLLTGLSGATCHTSGRERRDFRALQGYTFPEPEIKVFRNKGFEVSIPDSEGIQLMAFHGNVNKEMAELEAGRFSRDILTKEEGRWVFRDRKYPLRIGDKLYFWLFVQRHNLGYKLDVQTFEVTEYAEKQQKDPETEEPTSSSRPHTGPPDGANTNTDLLLSNCERTVVNITGEILSMQNQYAELMDTNEILRDIISPHQPSGKTLTFTGRVPPGEDALRIAQDIVKIKLKLDVNVVRATRKDQDIVFEVGRVLEKVDVIKAARKELKNSQIVLKF